MSTKTQSVQDLWTETDVHEKMAAAFDSCHYLSYLVPTVLMFIGICTFVLPAGIYALFRDRNYDFALKYKYTKEPHRNSNVLFRFAEIIGSALKNRISSGTRDFYLKSDRSSQDEGFVMYSKSKDGQMRRAAWRILQIAGLYIPLVFFWAIMEQIGSLWTFQAKELDGWIGGLYIQADQVEVLNNVFVVILIPIWTLIILPLLKASPIYHGSKTRLKNLPLHMMATGLFLTAMSQFVAWQLQLKLNSALTFTESNSDNFPVKLHFDDASVKSSVTLLKQSINADFQEFCESKTCEIDQIVDGACCKVVLDGSTHNLNSSTDSMIAWIFKKSDSQLGLGFAPAELTNQQFEGPMRDCVLENSKKVVCTDVTREAAGEDFINGATRINKTPVTAGRPISVLWIVLQYFLLTWGEVLLSTTALEFSYTQAPSNVKAISTALWYCTTSFANVVVLCLKSLESLSRASQLLLSAWMVIAAMLMFMVLAHRFTVYSQHDIDRLDKDDEMYLSVSNGGDESVDNSRTPMVKTSNS